MRTPRYRNLNSLAGIGGAGERKCDARSTLIPGDPGVKLLNEAQALRARPGNQRLTALPKEAAEVGLWKAELESLINGSAFRFVANPRAADVQCFSVPGAPTSSILRTCSASPIEDGGTHCYPTPGPPKALSTIMPKPRGRLHAKALIDNSHHPVQHSDQQRPFLQPEFGLSLFLFHCGPLRPFRFRHKVIV
jgi:hypothetical protein